MKTLFILDRRNGLPETGGDAEFAIAEEYLTDPAYNQSRYQRIVNLCSCDRHQGKGHYVSLVAEARGQEVIPSVKTIEDIHTGLLLNLLARDIEPVLQSALPGAGTGAIEVDAYFGQDPDERYAAVSRHLFERVRSPLLRARFEPEGARWRIRALALLDPADVPAHRAPALASAIGAYAAGPQSARHTPRASRTPSVAILHDGGEADAPSNGLALERFVSAARTLDLHAEIIDRNARDRLQRFDALFIRDTTNPGHYTYEFARHAAEYGMVVIDDPDSILQCNNKVYLHELFERYGIPMPRSALVHRENADEVAATLSFPCILKEPGSAFSRGVKKVDAPAKLHKALESLLEKSDIVIAQEYIPTPFDWRVGILDRRVIFVCQYFMAPDHWQVIKRDAAGRVEGRTVALAVGEAPQRVVQTALRAANLIGEGFYGVDLKQANGGCYLMEVNDNPNVDGGNEDQVLGPALYREIMGVIKRRIGERRQPVA